MLVKVQCGYSDPVSALLRCYDCENTRFHDIYMFVVIRLAVTSSLLSYALRYRYSVLQEFVVMAILQGKEHHVDPRLATIAQADTRRWYQKPNLRALYLVSESSRLDGSSLASVSFHTLHPSSLLSPPFPVHPNSSIRSLIVSIYDIGLNVETNHWYIGHIDDKAACLTFGFRYWSPPHWASNGLQVLIPR